MKLDRRYIITCCAVAAAAFAGCSQDHAPGTITADQGAPSAKAAGQGVGAGSATTCKTFAVCSDGQALAIALVANQGEIDEANAVLNRLSDANARAFAQQMITDHTKLRDALVAVAGNPTNAASMAGLTGVGVAANVNGTTMNAIVQQPNAISRKLQQESRTAIAELSMMSGTQLDQAYLDREVLDHLTTLALMEHVVIPSITSPILAMAVSSGTPIVKMHELAALQVQSTLEGACGGSTTDTSDGGAGGSTSDGGGGASSDGGASGASTP